MSYQLKCNFKEKLIEIDIARYLGGFTPLLRRIYYLENANEQLTGADLISEDENATLIYIQAKISQGLKTVNRFPSSSRKNRSGLEDIREYRHGLSLDVNDDYFLYFQLRKKAEGAIDFQHNILMNYANTGYSHAFYVAPLIIDKKEYENQFLDLRNYPDLPFYFHHYELKQGHWTSCFGFLPFLRNHMSIVPHEKIHTHEHYYAYSIHGIDVTWHSPQYIDNNPARLSDRLVTIMREFYYSKKNETVRTLADRLRELPIMKNLEVNRVEKAVDIISMHGQILEQEFGIKQLLITRGQL